MFAIHSKENTLLSNGEFISLIVSGAHSSLLIYEQMTSRSLGDTLDDAPGEVFDKIAIEMGFSYPGGPIIDTIASGYNDDLINFPKAKIKNRDHKYDFSFSGVKSAIIRELERRRTGKTLSSTDKAKIASSAQRAICDALIEKTIKSTKENLQERIIVSGGVASNTYLRERLSRECDKRRIEIFFPDKKLCVDNGAMVAFLGEELFLNNIQPSGVAFDLYPELSVDKVVLAP
jgi:N6-L-threonylcarbamoyladenine synthase